MKLSEAILIGASIRPASHQERFCHVENRGLCSDVWGAACEAVNPRVAKRSWIESTLHSDLQYLNTVQHQYFEAYFQMPARCPFSQRSYTESRRRVINHHGHTKTEIEREQRMAGITEECSLVNTLAGFVDHAFHLHGNSREEVAQMVEVYENTKQGAAITGFNLSHYQQENVRQAISIKTNLAARERERQRARKRLFVN